MATAISSKIDSTENNEEGYPHMKSARGQLEKVATDWPEGTLFRTSYGDAETIQQALHIGYGYELKDQGVTGIDLFIGLSDPAAAYNEVQECIATLAIKAGSDPRWIEWPRGFPDQNDYEQVTHCGANRDISNVVWVQNETLVKLSKMQLNESVLSRSDSEGRARIVSPNLQEFADGVWQAVYGMGL